MNHCFESFAGVGVRAGGLLALLSALAFGFSGCVVPADSADVEVAQEPARSYVGARTPETQGPPFSGAVWVGNTLYLSGQLGLAGGQVPETAEEEATNVLNNVRSLLEEAGLSMDDLVTVQVFASDVGDYAAFNEVYRTYFTSEFPARAFIGSGTLLFGARFEVQGIAARR